MRSAKRAGLCPRCLYPTRFGPTDATRRFWFRQFDDSELAAIAADFVGHPVRAEGITRQRMALVASARGKGV